MNIYQESIKNRLKNDKQFIHVITKLIDPRHIEGFMRLQYGSLNHLDNEVFNEEIHIGIACIETGGIEAAESNAKSFGL